MAQLALVTATAVLDGFRGIAIGICTVSENAFNAGVASIPSPVTDVGWDGWQYHSFLQDLVAGASTPTTINGSSLSEVEIDTKAMRKIKDTDVTVGVLEMLTEIGTATARFSARTRLLDKLS